ncbi:MAG: hypothetical protein ACXVAO_17230 [Vulcanimicrobiaceae bacterium]
MARVLTIPTFMCVAFIAGAMALSACSNGARTTSGDSNTESAALPVGHRWTVENEDGLLCYDSVDDLETARGMGDDFEEITPDGFTTREIRAREADWRRATSSQLTPPAMTTTSSHRSVRKSPPKGSNVLLILRPCTYRRETLTPSRSKIGK